MKALIDFYKLQPIQGHKEWVGYKIEHNVRFSHIHYRKLFPWKNVGTGHK